MSGRGDDDDGTGRKRANAASAGASQVQTARMAPGVGKVSRVQAEMGQRTGGRAGVATPAVAPSGAVNGQVIQHTPSGALSLGLDNEPAGEVVLHGPTSANNAAPLMHPPALQGPTSASDPAPLTQQRAAKPAPKKAVEPFAKVNRGRAPENQMADAWTGHAPTADEELAGSDVVDAFALAEVGSGAATHKAPAIDADAVLDALASTSAVLHTMAMLLEPWGYAPKLTIAQQFVDDKQTQLYSAEINEFDRWAPVIVAQRGVVGRAAKGCQATLGYLENRGLTPANVQSGHPAPQLLAEYADAAGTSALTQTATTKLQHADATLVKLGVHAAAYEAKQANEDVQHVKASTKSDPRSAPPQLATLSSEAAYLDEKAAGMQRLDKLGVAPTQMQQLELQTTVLRYRSQVANLQVSLRGLNAALGDATSGTIASMANAFAGTPITLLRFDLDRAADELATVDKQLATALHDQAVPAGALQPGAQDWLAEKQLESKQARIAVAQENFAAVVAARHLDGALFKRAEQGVADAHMRTLIGHVVVMIATAVATGGIGAIAGEAMGSMVITAGAATTLEGAATLATAARYAQVITSLSVDAAAFSAVQTKLNGGAFGVNFLETLALNGTVMAALRPWQALARGWLGLDEEAYAIWLAQSKTSKVLAARGAVATVEIFTAVAINNIGNRVLALAHGQTPDDATLLQFTLDAAAMAMGHIINMQLEGQLARFKSAGARAGELVGRMHRQRVAAKAVAATEVGGRTAAMDLVIEQRAILIEEATLWRSIAQDPAALKATKLTAEQASAKLGSIDAQLAVTNTIATTRLTLQMNNITEEVTGGRLWVGTAHDINAALGHARKLGFTVEILDAQAMAPAHTSSGSAATAPAANAGAERGSRIVKVAINGETFEIRERVARVPQAGDAKEYEFNDGTPGPLGDRKKYDPQNKKWALPIEGFKGGHYDIETLPDDKVFYRVGDATMAWGQWWTDTPLQSEAQYRMDVAVKREWADPATGEVEAGKTKSQEEKVLWCYAAKIPRGTTVYVGPVGSQGGVFMGGSSTVQYFIPKAWQLDGQGGEIVSKEVFVRNGHVPKATGPKK